MDKRKNISLISAVSIPILMILLIIGSIYWPRETAHPKFNFLYITHDSSQQEYLVQEGKLVPPKKTATNHTKFFIYDVTQNKSQEISFQDTQKLNLDTNIKSPDGFEVVSGGNDINIFSLFFGSIDNYNSRYLKKRNTILKLNLSPNTSYYTFRFLGWIKNQEGNQHG